MTELRGKLLDGYGQLVGSGLKIEDGVIVEIFPADDSVEGWVTPGFIDVHCHGGGGASFPDDPSARGVDTAVEAHRSMGTTAMIASTVSLIDTLTPIKGLAEACDEGKLVGIHLEGPYISPAKCGAQNPAAIRMPDLEELRQWLEGGRGWIKTMTIAPEVDDALAAAKLLLDYGAVPSWGHTSATEEQTRELLEATAAYAKDINFPKPPQTATHLFNAMPPLGHRNPGPVRELMAAARRGEAVVELVADTVHVHPDLVADVVTFVQEANPLGVVFVTDAMEGAGMPDGKYVLGGQDVDIVDGVARLSRNGAIAGGTARVAEEVQRMVRGGYLAMSAAVCCGVGAAANAVGLTQQTPGVTLEWKVGDRANAVAFTEDLEITTIVREGEFR
ncbi:amidohydrolase family protein [Trueperella pecoris]|uniref:Amidohydrolase family protein n=1 Tax=Trueperella pecoris TaxID=2733571 RepID=A0A7M1R3Z4_9ACTO|nr:amidohydrolase family protein [Trueperella pecoris]QOR48185.1 amidohydrolase family protein [Trueperella pecoris]